MVAGITPRTTTETLAPEVLRVLRNTYSLLALTLVFSALMAGASIALNFPYLGLWMLLPYFLFLWLTEKNKNSVTGLIWVFALTGWLGLTIGPIVNHYLQTSGSSAVLTALGGTAAIFFSCSGYVLVSRKNLGFMSGFLITGVIVAFVAMIANAFLQIQALSLALSCIFLVISSGLLMWQTSAIIHGGERNYISATVTLFVMIYNIFTSLLHLVGLTED